ncbi:MAG: MobF family relaxase, partial [Acidimicrobiales bacterium]
MNVGHDTAYLTDAVGGGREGYYRDAVAAGEPPGVWYGAGADELGLAGEVDADLMEAIYKSLLDPRDPASHDRSTWGTAALLSAAHKHYQTPEELYAKALAAEPHAGPERRTELRRESEQKARQATAFVDMTFSPHKSYSVAAAAFEAASNAAFARGDVWEAAHLEEKFRAMEDGIMVGARASIDYLQDRAGYGRVGKHTGGSGRWTDAHRWVVAQFLQHDSRAKDPQLHVHQAVLNRQMCADGKWRALDTTAIKHWRPAAGAIGERVMEEYMSVRAGLRFEVSPDGTGRWLVGVDPELVDQFSKRSNDIDPRTEQLADVFRERYQREPSLHD